MIKVAVLLLTIITVACMIFVLGSQSSDAENTIHTVPESGYTVSGNNITGINGTWLDSLPKDQDGLVRISLEIPEQINGKDVIQVSGFATSSSVFTTKSYVRIVNIDLSGATHLKTIGDKAFYKVSGDLYAELDVPSFTIPDSVTTIGGTAFRGLTGLKGDLVMPDMLRSLSGYTFYGCTGFTSLDLNNITSMSGGSTFYGCTGLTGTITIPASLTTWSGIDTFNRCSGIESVRFEGTGLTEIPNQSFYYCKGLSGDLVIPEGIKKIGNNAFSMGSPTPGFSSITLPSTISVIGGGTFSYNKNLTSVLFPESLSHSDGLSIGEGSQTGSFRYSGLVTLSIPSYVTYICSLAFADTPTLKTVYVHNDYTSGFLGGNPFTSINSSAVIVCDDIDSINTWYDAKELSRTTRNMLTVPLVVSFYDADKNSVSNLIPDQVKLLNKPLNYVHDPITGMWSVDPAYCLPEIPENLGPAKGWGVGTTGSKIIVPEDIMDFTSLYVLFPIEHQYIWLGEYQQTLFASSMNTPLPDNDARISGLVEGVDYVVEYLNPAYNYFYIEQIKWRIVSDSDGTYILLSERLMDAREYSGSQSSWSDSDIRAWLNSDAGFLYKFSGEHRSLLNDTLLADVGTTDKVYLLSLSELTDASLFVDIYDRNPDMREFVYSSAKMNWIGNSQNNYWWLRTSDTSPDMVRSDGFEKVSDTSNARDILGIRPMVTICLGMQYELRGAGTYDDPFSIVRTVSTISSSSGSNGSVDMSGDVNVKIGDDKTFTFMPNAGYMVDKVFVDGIEVAIIDNKYTFKDVTANHTIDVTFKLAPTYKVTVDVTKDNDPWTGNNRTFKLVDAQGKDFLDLTDIYDGKYTIWDISGSPISTGITVTVGGSDASARVDYYTITLTNGTGIEFTEGSGIYLKGTDVSINAVESTGYVWSNWMYTTNDSDLSSLKSYTICSISEKVDYTANAVPGKYTLTLDSNGGTEMSMEVTYGQPIGSMPVPTKESNAFVRWMMIVDGINVELTENMIWTHADDRTAVALWVVTSEKEPLVQDVPWTMNENAVVIKMDGDTVNRLLGSGISGLSLAVDESPKWLTDAERSAFGGRTVYEIMVVNENGKPIMVNDFGKITIMIPYQLDEKDVRSEIYAYYYIGNGELDKQGIKCSYVDGYAVFETDHLSLWTISEKPITQPITPPITDPVTPPVTPPVTSQNNGDSSTDTGVATAFTILIAALICLLSVALLRFIRK